MLQREASGPYALEKSRLESGVNFRLKRKRSIGNRIKRRQKLLKIFNVHLARHHNDRAVVGKAFQLTAAFPELIKAGPQGNIRLIKSV